MDSTASSYTPPPPPPQIPRRGRPPPPLSAADAAAALDRQSYLRRRLSRSSSVPPPARVDLISLLPDELILCILKFLSLTQAARTGILSKRWRNLWASNPTLDFNQALYASYCASSGLRRLLYKPPPFESWVTSILTLSESRIKTLKIFFRGFDASVVGLWLRIASKRAVEDIRLKYSPVSNYELPSAIADCQSLVALELRDIGSNGRFRLTTFVKLASLKTLRLGSVCLDCQLVSTLIADCPLLENLSFEVCSLISASGARTLNVTSAVLKTLTIKRCRTLSFKVDAPHLLSFRYKGTLGEDYILKNLSSIVEAKFSFVEPVNQSSILKLLQGVWHAKSLTISHLRVKKDEKLDSSLEMAQYSNLKYLQLSAFHQQDHIEFTANFLKKFPNLETFILDASQVHVDNLQVGPTIQKVDYGFAVEHLKILEIQGFGGESGCFSFLIYILENAGALQKVKLIYRKGLPEFDDQRALCRMVRRAQKASQAKVTYSTCY